MVLRPYSVSWLDNFRKENAMMAVMINSAIFMYSVPIREGDLVILPNGYLLYGLPAIRGVRDGFLVFFLTETIL